MKKSTVFICCLLAALVGLVQSKALAVCNVTINASPGTTVCSNQTCTLTANPSGGVAPYTYLWSNSQTSQSIVAPTSGTYSVTITDAGLCIANNSLPVLINPLPTPFVSGLLCVCVNSLGVTYSTPPVPGSSHAWVVTGGAIVTGQGTNQITVDWGAIAGAGAVKVTETSVAGCVNSSTLNVTITAYPVASVTVGNNNACSGTTVNFQGPAGAGYTYVWNFNDPPSGTNNTSTLQNPSHIFNTYGCGTTTYNVILTVTNSCGCSTTSLPQAVTIKQQPNPQLTDQDPISPFSNCDQNPSPANHDFQLTLNNTTPNGGCISGYTIDWGDGTVLSYTAAFTTATHLYTNLGAFNLVFTATGTNGCTNSITYTVANQSVPSVGISNNGGNTAGCYPITFTFTIDGAANNSPGTMYEILYGDGATETKTNEELLVNNIVSHTYTSSSCGQGIPGNQFTVRVLATNACLITVEATVNQIKIYKPPVASFTTNPTPIGCVNTNVCVTNTSTPGYGFNCNQITTWLWNFGDPGGANNTSTLETPPCHTYSTPGTYTITLTASNDQCQSGSVISHMVTINPFPALFTVTGGGEYCSGGAGVLVGLSDSEPGVNYRLFINGVTIGGIVAGTGLPIIFGNQSAPGIYTVHATNQVTSCSNTMTGSVSIVINPLPTANAGLDQIIPYGTSSILGGTAGAGTAPLSYLWTPAGSIASGGTTLTPQTTNLYTSTTFTLLVTDSKGCTASDNVIVSSGGNPLSVICNATPGTICNNGASVQLYAVAAGGSGTYDYSWVSNPVGSPVWTSTLPNPVVNPTVTTTYTVTVNDGFNTAITQVAVTVNPSPLVYVLTGGGEFCSGGSGVQIGLSGAQMGISYQLFLNGMPVGPAMMGTGGPIIFGIFTTGGAYTAVATNIVTSCSSMMAGNASIVVNPLPVANAGVDHAIPFGTSSTLSGTVSGGTIPYSYAWSPVSNIASGANSLTPTTTNLYSSVMFTFSVTDSKGCSSNDNVLVSVGGDPLSASCNATPNMMCNGTTAQLSVNPTGGSGTYTYAWVSNPAGWSSTLQNPTVSPNNSTTYTVTVNDGFTTAACNVQVTVNPLPQVTNSPLSKTICSGTSTSISLFSTVPGTTYQWTSLVISGSVTGNSASGIGTGFIGDILVNTGMVTGSVNYFITPVANGCFGTPVNYVVAVQPLPLIGTSPASQTICSGAGSQPITISSSVAGTTYNWSTVSTGGISGAQVSGTSNPVPGWVLNNSAATAGTVAVNIVPTFQGCTGQSLSYLINVNPLPVPSIAGPINVCVGSSGQQYSTEPGMSGYTWSVSPGGTITSGSGTNQVAITWLSTGSQTVNVSYANTNGCSAINPSTYAVTVNGVPAAAGAITGLSAVCVNASGVPYSIAPLQNALTYNWTLPLGASMASGSGTNSITVNFPNYVTTGNIRVAGVNSCFTGTSSPNLQVKTNAQLTGQVNLNNMTIGYGQEECLAVQSIILGGEAPFTVQSGGLVRLIAGNNIVFLTGTSINPGGYLSALITQQCIPCNTLKSNDLTHVAAESDGPNETLSTPQDNPYFMIYPNPTDGIFTIASKNRDMDHTVVLQIFDVMGKMKVEERLEPFTKREFSISEFPAGIYHLRLIVDDNTQVIRMIKAK